MIDLIRTIETDQLGAPTPCREYDVGQLVNHLLFWGPSLEGAARKESIPPPEDDDRDIVLTHGDWAVALEAQLERLVAAWSEPVAWEGTTTMGSPMELPAPMVGGMVLGELVVHGWDLARATGQQPQWAAEIIETTHQQMAEIAEQGRQMGVFGPEVPVPKTGSTLDRMLGLTGRDPQWAG